MLSETKELLPPGKVVGETVVDFSLDARPIPETGLALYETFHGKHIGIEYEVNYSHGVPIFLRVIRTAGLDVLCVFSSHPSRPGGC